jgi:1-deoxy-D-xylulose-5-phosphate synthase
MHGDLGKTAGLDKPETVQKSAADERSALQILPTLRGPEQLRRMSIRELQTLAEEIRLTLNEVVARNGGHLASNLGVTELTIALHRVFDFLHDRLIFDVGHQVYVHKLLTGRYPQFSTLRQRGGISGFPAPEESDYDVFRTAHASAAISTAVGLAVAGDRAEKPWHTVAVVGDGAMTGGLAFEGLNHAGHLNVHRLIVVLNDNEMAISPTVGALQKYLDRVRLGSFYNTMRDRMRRLVQSIPMVGEGLENLAERATQSVSDMIQPGQIFRELGFRYFGPVDGHDLDDLLQIFDHVRGLEGPILIHVSTQKGRGVPYAMEDPEKFHSPSGYELPATPEDKPQPRASAASYSQSFVEALIEEAEKDERVCAITAAMPSGTGLDAFQERFPDRYFDVGICEPHSVAFAAGLGKAGMRPVVCLYSTFLQRAFDQVFQEMCLQEDVPVVIGVDRGGLVGGDGPTTNGVFDIAYLRTLPNLIHCSPKDAVEQQAMLRWALAHGGPVAIRYPRDVAADLQMPPGEIELGRGEIVLEGRGVALLAYGPQIGTVLSAAKLLQNEHQVFPTVANARFAKPIDERLVRNLLRTHPLVVTVEEHALMGGFGSAVLERASELDLPVERLRRIGIPDRFVAHGSRGDCLRETGLDAASIAGSVVRWLRQSARQNP